MSLQFIIDTFPSMTLYKTTSAQKNVKKNVMQTSRQLVTTIPRKMSNNLDTQEVTFYGLGNQLRSTLVMSPAYRTNRLHSGAKLAGYGTHKRMSYEIQPTNDQECAKMC